MEKYLLKMQKDVYVGHFGYIKYADTYNFTKKYFITDDS